MRGSCRAKASLRQARKMPATCRPKNFSLNRSCRSTHHLCAFKIEGCRGISCMQVLYASVQAHILCKPCMQVLYASIKAHIKQRGCCRYLAEILPRNGTLQKLYLGYNDIRDEVLAVERERGVVDVECERGVGRESSRRLHVSRPTDSRM